MSYRRVQFADPPQSSLCRLVVTQQPSFFYALFSLCCYWCSTLSPDGTGSHGIAKCKNGTWQCFTTIWLAAGLLLPSTSIRASRCITLPEIGSNQSLVLPNRRSRFRALLPRCCCLVSLCSFDRCTILSASSLLLPCIVTQTCLEKSRHQTFDIEFSVNYYTVCWELTTAVV